MFYRAFFNGTQYENSESHCLRWKEVHKLVYLLSLHLDRRSSYPSEWGINLLETLTEVYLFQQIPAWKKKESGCVNHDRKVCTHLTIRGLFHDENINFWIIERVSYKSCYEIVPRWLQNWIYSGEVCSHMWIVCL